MNHISELKKRQKQNTAVIVAMVLAVIILGVYGPGIKPGEFVYMQF